LGSSRRARFRRTSAHILISFSKPFRRPRRARGPREYLGCCPRMLRGNHR
jgi:hypothetical protein